MSEGPVWGKQDTVQKTWLKTFHYLETNSRQKSVGRTEVSLWQFWGQSPPPDIWAGAKTQSPTSLLPPPLAAWVHSSFHLITKHHLYFWFVFVFPYQYIEVKFTNSKCWQMSGIHLDTFYVIRGTNNPVKTHNTSVFHKSPPSPSSQKPSFIKEVTTLASAPTDWFRLFPIYKFYLL